MQGNYGTVPSNVPHKCKHIILLALCSMISGLLELQSNKVRFRPFTPSNF